MTEDEKTGQNETVEGERWVESGGSQTLQIADISTLIWSGREKLGLSRSVFATRMGMSKSFLEKIEDGKRLLSIPLLIRIFDALGYTVTVTKGKP